MIIPKKNRIEVYSQLFKEGVLVAKKDHFQERNPFISYPVPNTQVMKLMRGFTTKGYVKEQFAWQHYYWFLTNEGIEYLREYLHLPSTIVPATLKKSPKFARPPARPAAFRRREKREDRREYRGDFQQQGVRQEGETRQQGRGFGRGFTSS